MKLCPNCKTELDDNARFCLRCMTSLDDKEQIPSPARKAHRWPLVLLCLLGVVALVITIVIVNRDPSTTPKETNATTTENSPSVNPTEDQEPTTENPTTEAPAPEETATVSHTADGVTYTYRAATKEDLPTAIGLDNYYILIQVEGSPSDGTYYIPSFVGDDMSALVIAVGDGAFAGTNAQAIDLGYTVRYVLGNAFGGYALTDLHLHDDVYIDEAAFSGCTESLTIHCPAYLDNTQGVLWPDLATDYGFQWQDAII